MDSSRLGTSLPPRPITATLRLLIGRQGNGEGCWGSIQEEVRSDPFGYESCPLYKTDWYWVGILDLSTVHIRGRTSLTGFKRGCTPENCPTRFGLLLVFFFLAMRNVLRLLWISRSFGGGSVSKACDTNPPLVQYPKLF